MGEDARDAPTNAVGDSHQWLEDDTSEVQRWVSRQNELARSRLETPVREQLFTRIRSLQESIATKTADEGDSATDDAEAESGSSSVMWSFSSPDGSMVGRIVDHPDARGKTIRIVDAEENVVTERTAGPRVPPPLFAWTTSGFYYVDASDGGDGPGSDKSICYVDLDGDDRVVTAEIPPTVWPLLRTDDATGRLLVTMSDQATADDLYVLTDGALEPAIVGRDAQLQAFPDGGTVYVLTTLDAPRKRLLACPIGEITDVPLSEMREVVPETDGVIETFAVIDDRVVVHRLVDACSELAVYDAPGTNDLVSTVDLPPFSSVSGLSRCEDGERFSFQIEGFDRPPRGAVASLSTGRAEGPDRSDSDLPDLTVTCEWVDSTDGVDVPVFVVNRADLEPDGDAPTLLHGYGAHRQNMIPSFDVTRIPFLEAGGIFAQVCARGGSEFGEQWHQAGMGTDKRRTFDDFVAAAEHLIDRGYTSSDSLGIHGHSSGGLAVGAVLTQRPELFSVAVARAPILDMLRFHHFPHGEAMTAEFGSPDDEDTRSVLLEYSPYHNVGEREYPAIMFCVTEADPQVHPAHARKMTARLQARADSHPERSIVCRTYEGSGHSMADLEVDIDVWTFVFEQLELR